MTMATTKKKATGFSAAEKAAMRERAKELKAQEKASNDRAAGEKDIKASLAKMAPADRTLGKKVHEIVTKAAPDLMPKTWYGMPAYANDDGKVVCWFKNAGKFGDRYQTLGFESAANVDDGSVWPVVYAIMKIGPADEKKIAALVKKAVS